MTDERKKMAAFIQESLAVRLGAAWDAGSGPRCMCGVPAVVLSLEAGDALKTGPLCHAHLACAREAVALFGHETFSVQTIAPLEYVALDVKPVDQ